MKCLYLLALGAVTASVSLMNFLSGGAYYSPVTFYASMGLALVGAASLIAFLALDFEKGGVLRCRGSGLPNLAVRLLALASLVFLGLSSPWSQVWTLRFLSAVLLAFVVALAALTTSLTLLIKLRKRGGRGGAV